MFIPSSTTLTRYADVLVNFALGGCEGVKAGDKVLVSIPECATAMLPYLHRAILRADADPIIDLIPDGLQRDFFTLANDEQLLYRPMKRLLATVDEIDHRLFILAEADKYELSGINSTKIIDRFSTIKPFREALQDKEHHGKLSWTIGMYGTPAMSTYAGISLEEYWTEIIHACFLDDENPIARWRETEAQIHTTMKKLNDCKIERVHVVGDDVDLKIHIGKQRKWLGGSGRNIPSFEIFTSPDWRGTEGWMRFNMPLSYQNNIIRGIELEFKDGLVTSSKATENEPLLKEMIAQKNANKIGEFSLTDKRLSRITKFMGETLFDENVGGPFGNTHIALGMSYKDAYEGNIGGTTAEEWENLGYNDSVIHTDMMSTTDRTVTATLADGTEKVIYRDGEFVV